MTTIAWQQFKLGDLLEIKHGYAFKGEFFTDEGEFVLLTPGNFLEDGGLKLKGEKEKYYTGEIPDEFVLRKGDLLVAMTDLTQNAPILGSPAFVPEDGRFLHNQRLGKVTNIRRGDIIPEFLFYLFNAATVRGQIKGSAAGATVRHTSPSRIYEVSVEIPSLPLQHHIAGILSAYDDLIENNQRRIKILEEMARSLYREWFVHFRFPGHDRVKMLLSPLGPIPQGWEVKSLNDVVEDIVDYRGKTPTKLNGEWANEGILALSALNVKGGRLVNLGKSRLVSEELYRRWMKNPLKRGDILMTSEAPLGELFFLCREERYCLSQRLYSIRASHRVIAPVILYLCLESEQSQHELSSRASGATVSGIRQSELRKIPIIVPPRAIQARAEPVLTSGQN